MRKLVLIIFLIVLLSSSASASDQEAIRWWDCMMAQEEKEMGFIQTVITVFPGRTSLTIDNVALWSPFIWTITRTSEQHGTLTFISGKEGFRAVAEDEGIVYQDQNSRLILDVLHPTFYSDSTNLRFVGHAVMQGIDTVILERQVLGKGVIRYWIDIQSHRLLKEESIDELGKVVYILFRGHFVDIGEVPVWSQRVQNHNEENRKFRIFSDEKRWWHEVLLSSLKKQNHDTLFPRRLPPGTHLVAALKEQDGTIILRYYDGRRAFSVFQKMEPKRVKEKYVDGVPYAVFTTTRKGVSVTIVGPLERNEMEEIVDSLEQIVEGDLNE